MNSLKFRELKCLDVNAMYLTSELRNRNRRNITYQSLINPLDQQFLNGVDKWIHHKMRNPFLKHCLYS